MCVCVCLCVCERERERERDKESIIWQANSALVFHFILFIAGYLNTQREREREREGDIKTAKYAGNKTRY